MTPQQKKAKELVEKLKPFVDSEIAGETGFLFSREQQTKNAKQCALIVCNYSIEQLIPWTNTYSGRKQIEEILSVKQEITKLT